MYKELFSKDIGKHLLLIVLIENNNKEKLKLYEK